MKNLLKNLISSKDEILRHTLTWNIGKLASAVVVTAWEKRFKRKSKQFCKKSLQLWMFHWLIQSIRFSHQRLLYCGIISTGRSSPKRSQALYVEDQNHGSTEERILSAPFEKTRKIEVIAKRERPVTRELFLGWHIKYLWKIKGRSRFFYLLSRSRTNQKPFLSGQDTSDALIRSATVFSEHNHMATRPHHVIPRDTNNHGVAIQSTKFLAEKNSSLGWKPLNPVKVLYHYRPPEVI